MIPSNEPVEQAKQSGSQVTARDMLRRLLQSPATWVFVAAWVLSVLLLLATGHLDRVLAALVVVLSLLTVALTPQAPPLLQGTETAASSRGWIWAQLAVLLAVYLFTGYHGLVLQAGAGSWYAVLPGIGPLVSVIDRLPLEVMNPLLYVALPLIVLLLLHVHVRDLGFQQGYHSWRVIAAWCFLPIVLILLNLVRVQRIIGYVATSVVGNSLRNGFFEEFLFRGALLTRLSRLFGSAWGWHSPRCSSASRTWALPWDLLTAISWAHWH